MKKKLLFILIITLLLTSIPLTGFAQDSLKLWVEGRFVSGDVKPFILNGRTMVPIRMVSEALGLKVDWYQKEQKIMIYPPGAEGTGDGQVLYIGDPKLYLDHDSDFYILMDVAPMIRNDRTFLPIRAVAEIFGYHVGWDQGTRTVFIGEGYEESLGRYPIQQKIGTIKFVTAQRYGVEPSELRSQEELVEYCAVMLEYIDEIHQEFLRHLQEKGLLDIQDQNYLGWVSQREKWVNKEFFKDSTGGSMGDLKILSLYENFTTSEIKRLAKKYYNYDVQFPK